MSATIKIIVILLAVLTFVIGAFVLASKLFGSADKTVRREKKQSPPKAEPRHIPAAPAFTPAAQPQGVLPNPKDYVHLMPDAGYHQQISHADPPPRQGKISYGNATQFVDVDIPNNKARQTPGMDAGYVRGINAEPAAMRLTITGDNGAPEYFVDIKESELPITIGRAKSDARGRSIVVNEPTVSSQHVRISIKNGVLSVCDCRSTCGTVVNGENGSSLVLKNDAKDTRSELYAERFNMVLGRMNVRVELLEPFRSAVHTHCCITVSACCNGAVSGKGTYFDSFSIGRQNADLCLPDPMISRMHAIVFRSIDGSFVLRDQNSTNGILEAHSGKRISESPLKKGTVLMLGDTELHVENIVLGVSQEYASSMRPKTVYFDSVSAAQNHRYI